jgi:hypothetical protein
METVGSSKPECRRKWCRTVYIYTEAITTLIWYYAVLKETTRHLPAKFHYQITANLRLKILITAFTNLISI